MSLRWPLGLFVVMGSILASLACVDGASTLNEGQSSVELRLDVARSGVSSQALWSLARLEGAKALVVSIQDKTGKAFYNLERVKLYDFEGTPLSHPLSLAPGSYVLTKLLVIDDAGTVLYAVPVEGSSLAHLVEDPLPISFDVSKDAVTTVRPQVLSTKEHAPEDFGYASFKIDVVDTLDFLATVFSFDEARQEFVLIEARIQVTNNAGAVLYSGSLGARTNKVTVPQGHERYHILISKSGYKSYSQGFNGTELASYFESAAKGPLNVVLEKLVYYASCQAILKAGASKGDGVYTIDPDGVGAGELPFDVYCDMTTDDGGWTLCARVLPDVQGNFAKKVWGGKSDGTENFGVNCQRLVALKGGAAEYRVTTTPQALQALTKTITASAFDSNIDFNVGTASDPIREFYRLSFCGGDGGCARYMQADGLFVKRRHHYCGGSGCANNQALYFGTNRTPIIDYFGSRSTNHNGVWHYLYQHGACYYDGSRACWGSLTEDFDSGFILKNKHTHHWIR